ncbi:MAG: hypothetical protein V4463_02010 [Pseudomonadota bacterium]
MKPRRLLMGAAVVGAAALLLLGDRSPSNGVAEAVVRPKSRAPAPEGKPKVAGEPVIGHLLARAVLIGDAAELGGEGGSAFRGQDWAPAPVKAPPPPPPPPPTAPPLPFTFLGKAASAEGLEVYLVRGEKTYIVHPKEVIEGTYRIDAIVPPMMTLTYLPLNQVQQINIGVLD